MEMTFKILLQNSSALKNVDPNSAAALINTLRDFYVDLTLLYRLVMLATTEHEYPLCDKKIMYKNSLNYTVNFIKMFLIQICSTSGSFVKHRENKSILNF